MTNKEKVKRWADKQGWLLLKEGLVKRGCFIKEDGYYLRFLLPSGGEQTMNFWGGSEDEICQ